MSVREIIRLAALLIGDEQLYSNANSSTATNNEDVTLALHAYNLAERSVALDYIPLKYEEEIAFSSGKILYTQLSRRACKIQRVRIGGRAVNFESRPEFIRLPLEAGRAEVLYSYIPEEKRIDSKPEFGNSVPASILAHGTACELCLSRGMYEEAALWEKRFRDGLKGEGALRSTLALRSRRWA